MSFPALSWLAYPVMNLSQGWISSPVLMPSRVVYLQCPQAGVALLYCPGEGQGQFFHFHDLGPAFLLAADGKEQEDRKATVTHITVQ